MAEATVMIAVSFPVAQPQRDLLRKILGQPLPAMYTTGAEERPCSSCGMTLNVGPRLLAQVLAHGGKLYCPICLIATVGTEAANVMSLGNPESRFET